MQIGEAAVERQDGSEGGAELAVEAQGDELRLRLRGSGAGGALRRVVIATDLEVDRFVEHGWQSWSTALPRRASEIDAGRGTAPRWLRDEMLTEGDLAGTAGAGDLFLAHEGGVVGSLDPTGAPLSCRVRPDGSVELAFDVDGLVIAEGEEVELGGIIDLEGRPGPALSEWATRSAAGRARPGRPQPLGWCSWYQYFTKVTAAEIEANLELAARHGLELVQIDDGWQPSIGEWRGTADRFGGSMASLADKIRGRGLSAGVWTAPFLALEGSPLALARPEWILRDEQGRPRRVMHHGDWGGWVWALDTSRDDVLEHLGGQFRELRSLGFDYFKIDFLYAAAMPGQRSGQPMARHEALRRGLEAIRDAIGEDAYLLGCGCPLGAAVGIVDACRVSEDVAPFWAPRLHFPSWPECSVATANAVEQSLRRAPLHRRFFSADPDCALLRPSDTELSAEERRVLAEVVVGTGGFTVVSDDLSLYGPAEWELLAEMGEQRGVVDAPLELVDPLADSHLELRGPSHRLEVDLSTPRSTLAFDR